jgi:Domain of unknown function (DUF1996)
MRKHLPAILTVLALAVLPSIAATAPAAAVGKVKCQETTGILTADPIVRHNEGVTGHQHQYFGNAALPDLANPSAAQLSDLQGKATSCTSNPKDTAAYWQPTLRTTAGAIVPAATFIAYYRSSEGDDFGAAEPMPADTRLVVPVSKDTSITNWTCGQFENVSPSTTIPDCSGAKGGPGRQLTSHITFPSCWDGVRPSHSSAETGDTSDNEHYAYRVGKECPQGFPIGVTELRMTTGYDYTGNGKDLVLSSDAMHGTSAGASLHGDFWQTWAPGGLEDLLAHCVTVRPERPAFADECG